MSQFLINIAGTVARHLWAVSWQVTILILLVWLVGRAFRNTSTVFRYSLWIIVLARLCIPVGFSLPDGLERLLGEQIEASRFAAPVRLMTKKVAQLTFMPDSPENITAEGMDLSADPPFALSPDSVTGLIWAGIVSLIAVMIITRMVLLSRRLKSSLEIDRSDLVARFESLKTSLGIRKQVILRYLDLYNSDVPAVIGIRRPNILLPRKIADSWELEDIEPILLHELAHVKRGDLVLNWLQVLVQAVYFFHPLVWYVNRHIRQLREELSDDLAVHHLGTGKKHYLASILRVMESVVHEPTLGFVGIGFSERKHSLGWRVERMLKTGYEGYNRITSRMASGIALVILIGGLYQCSLLHAQTMRTRGGWMQIFLRMCSESICLKIQLLILKALCMNQLVTKH